MKKIVLSILLFTTFTFLYSQVKVNIGKLTKQTNIETSYPDWSPDGTKIVYQSNRNDNDSEIYVMNSDGTEIKRLTLSPGLDETPVWSPDGKQIMFVSNRTGNNDVYIMDASGENLKNLTQHPSNDGHPHFLPDGKGFVFGSTRAMPESTWSGDQWTNETNHEIYEMLLDGTGLKRITDFSGWDTFPDVSPDGSKVAFRRRLNTDNGNLKYNSEVFVANRDGSNAYNLTNYPDHDGWPAWSPDGTKIAFASERERFDNWQIYTVNIDGSELTRITDFDSQGGYFAKPRWSSDGSAIICTRSKDGNVEIFTIELNAEKQ